MSKKSNSRHCRKPWKKRKRFAIKMTTVVHYKQASGLVVVRIHEDTYRGYLDNINKQLEKRLKYYKDRGEITDFKTEFVK